MGLHGSHDDGVLKPLLRCEVLPSLLNQGALPRPPAIQGAWVVVQGMGEGEPGWKSRLPPSQQLQGRANGDRLATGLGFFSLGKGQ